MSNIPTLTFGDFLPGELRVNNRDTSRSLTVSAVTAHDYQTRPYTRTQSQQLETCEVAFVPTFHGQQRRAERSLTQRDLQSAVKYGEKEPANPDFKTGRPRWKYTFADVVYITDETSTVEITSYSQELPLKEVQVSERLQRRIEAARRRLEEDPGIITSHMVIVVDQSGSMNKADMNGHRSRSRGVYYSLAEEFTAKQLSPPGEDKIGGSKTTYTDVVTLIEMRDGPKVVFRHEPLSWALYNKFVQLSEQRNASSHGNYFFAVKEAFLQLNLFDHQQCSLALFFLSDGKPSDPFTMSTSFAKRFPDQVLQIVKENCCRFKDRFSFMAVGFGGAVEEFGVLQQMVQTAQTSGSPRSSFSYAQIKVSLLGAALTTLASTTTVRRTMLSRLNDGNLSVVDRQGKPRAKRTDVVREQYSKFDTDISAYLPLDPTQWRIFNNAEGINKQQQQNQQQQQQLPPPPPLLVLAPGSWTMSYAVSAAEVSAGLRPPPPLLVPASGSWTMSYAVSAAEVSAGLRPPPARHVSQLRASGAALGGTSAWQAPLPGTTPVGPPPRCQRFVLQRYRKESSRGAGGRGGGGGRRRRYGRVASRWDCIPLMHPAATGIAVRRSYFGEGTERIVYKMTEIDADGCPVGAPLVAKDSLYLEPSRHTSSAASAASVASATSTSSGGRSNMREIFHKRFLDTQREAQRLAVLFNGRLDRLGVDCMVPRIEFLDCSVYSCRTHQGSETNDGRGGGGGYGSVQVEGEVHFLAERRLDVERYIKWNNNAGGVDGIQRKRCALPAAAGDSCGGVAYGGGGGVGGGGYDASAAVLAAWERFMPFVIGRGPIGAKQADSAFPSLPPPLLRSTSGLVSTGESTSRNQNGHFGTLAGIVEGEAEESSSNGTSSDASTSSDDDDADDGDANGVSTADLQHTSNGTAAATAEIKSERETTGLDRLTVTQCAQDNKTSSNNIRNNIRNNDSANNGMGGRCSTGARGGRRQAKHRSGGGRRSKGQQSLPGEAGEGRLGLSGDEGCLEVSALQVQQLQNSILPEDIPQAFTHFTYNVTRREKMVCDLQGVLDSKGGHGPPIFALTDPCIHCEKYCRSNSQRDKEKYGRTNRGHRGMVEFFNSHQCNPVCRLLGIDYNNKGSQT